MKDLEKVLKKFGMKELPEVAIFKTIEEVGAEEEKIRDEIAELRWLIHSLKEDVEESKIEVDRWKKYYTAYAHYFKTLNELKNYLDAVLFEIRSARKEKITLTNALIREVGEKRVAFSNLISMLTRIESAPLGSRIKALEELKKVFETTLKKEELKGEKGGEKVSATAEEGTGKTG